MFRNTFSFLRITTVLSMTGLAFVLYIINAAVSIVACAVGG